MSKPLLVKEKTSPKDSDGSRKTTVGEARAAEGGSYGALGNRTAEVRSRARTTCASGAAAGPAAATATAALGKRVREDSRACDEEADEASSDQDGDGNCKPEGAVAVAVNPTEADSASDAAEAGTDSGAPPSTVIGNASKTSEEPEG